MALLRVHTYTPPTLAPSRITSTVFSRMSCTFKRRATAVLYSFSASLWRFSSRTNTLFTSLRHSQENTPAVITKNTANRITS